MSGVPQEWADAHEAKMAAMGRGKLRTTEQSSAVAAGGRNRKAMQAHAQGVPNATEQRFFDEYLAPLLLVGEILKAPEFSPFVAKLGPRSTLEPDWGVLFKDGYKVFDVKGTTRAKLTRRKRETDEAFTLRKATTKGTQVPYVEGDAAVKHRWWREKFPGIPLGIAWRTEEGWKVRWK